MVNERKNKPQQVLMLVEQGFTTSEIAKLMNVKLTTASAYIYKARSINSPLSERQNQVAALVAKGFDLPHISLRTSSFAEDG